MTTRKHFHADIERQRSHLFATALVVVSGLTLMAFEWKVPAPPVYTAPEVDVRMCTGLPEWPPAELVVAEPELDSTAVLEWDILAIAQPANGSSPSTSALPAPPLIRSISEPP